MSCAKGSPTTLSAPHCSKKNSGKGRYGSPRVYAELVAQGYKTSRRRVAQRMKALGLRARRPKTTQADGSPVAPNLLDRQFSGHDKNEVWVGDVTYIWTLRGWLYLAILVDLGTRGIVGWATSDHCDTDLCLLALERAVARRHPPAGLMHHTDRGSTYTAKAYQKRMRQLGMVASMSRKGDCWDNAVAESTIGTIKAELLADWIPSTRAIATHALFFATSRDSTTRNGGTRASATAPPLEVEFALLKSAQAA